jgi:hypothetical protein
LPTAGSVLFGVLIAHHSICGDPPRGTGREMKEPDPTFEALAPYRRDEI